MSALGTPVLINPNRAYWLSTIGNDVIHSTIVTQEIDANLARFSTVYVSDFLQTSTLKASTFTLTNLDLSEANISTLKTSNAFTSSLTWASDLSGGSGTVTIVTDPSGVKIDGDPIVFGNLVYFTSSITVVPVSTIVDTDILAQRGFFSTLSSGSISTGNLRADTASISSLTVSSITTQDISGFHPSDWSLYPTLNSSIQFQPAYVLSNVNNRLYFAGYELTDVSGGGADWSVFPALQDVSMNNFSLRGLSTLQYNDGAKLYSQTGNNLFYNGQQISYGTAGAASNWSLYPALQNVNMNGYGLASPGNLPVVAASNITVNAQRFSTVIDQGLNVASFADYNVTVQNGNKGRINLTANTGTQGLFGEINMTANGGTVAGVGTGGLITMTANTPVGTLCNATSAIKLSASGINSYAGAVPPIGSLAGYNFIYGTGGVNISAGLPSLFPNVPLTTFLYGSAGVTTSSDFYVPNIYPYWDGLTTPPDLMITGRYIIPNLAQVYVQLSNVKNMYMGGAALIQDVRTINMSNAGGAITNLSSINGANINTFINQSNILASNVTATISVNTAVVNTQSTITNNLYCPQQGSISTVLWNFAIGLSSVFNNIAVNNIKIADDITGVTNAPNPLQSRILNFSTINSFNVSTTDLWVSSINGQPIDISGNPFVNSNKFSTLFTSSFKTSTMSGYPLAGAVPLSTIVVEGGLQFTGDYQGIPTSGRFLSSVRNINSFGQPLLIQAGGTNQEFSLLYPSFLGGNAQYVRIGDGSAYDTKIRNLNGWGAVSTTVLMASTLMGPPAVPLDVSGNLSVRGNVTVPSNNVFNFSGGTVLGNNNLINSNMPCFTSGSVFGCNLGAVAANQFLIGSGTGAFGAAKLYCDFPGDNWGVDIIDANGTTLFETLNCYDTGGYNFQTNLYGVSSIVGYTPNTPPGGATAVGIGGILVAPTVSTQALFVSSINGAAVDGGSFDDRFSTLYTSSFQFSTATSVGSNTNFNYPIFLDYDQAGNTTTAGVSIAVQGHNFGTGAVVNRIEMGARANGDNYIMSVWPGQNLEDLFIDATQVTVRDSDGFSTIINENPYGVRTNGVVEVGSGSGVVNISTNNITVGIQTKLTKDTISTTFLNTPYGNNLYMAGQQQPCVFFGNDTFPSGGGTTSTLITLPTSYTNKDFSAQITYKDSVDNTEIYWSTQTANTFLAFGGSTHGFSWTTFGNLPFTG